MATILYARVIAGIVHGAPIGLPDTLKLGTDLFTPDEAALYHACPAGVGDGWTFDGTNFEAPLPPAAPPLASIQATLCADIDKQAQAVRDLYVTPGGAQAATYLFKQSQAQAAQAAQSGADAGKTAAQLASAYPYLANEIGITVDPSTSQPSVDIYGVARAVVATVLDWQPINLIVEATRLKTKVAINAAATAVAAQAAHDAVVWPPAP